LSLFSYSRQLGLSGLATLTILYTLLLLSLALLITKGNIQQLHPDWLPRLQEEAILEESSIFLFENDRWKMI